MQPSEHRNLAKIERSMIAARKLRAETAAQGVGQALNLLLRFASSLVERFRHPSGLATPH